MLINIEISAWANSQVVTYADATLLKHKDSFGKSDTTVQKYFSQKF